MATARVVKPKKSIAVMCKVLRSLGVTCPAMESFRAAKYNRADPDVFWQMWRLLHDVCSLREFDFFGASGDASLLDTSAVLCMLWRTLDVESNMRAVCCKLAGWGYPQPNLPRAPSEELEQASQDNPEEVEVVVVGTTRRLLVAVGWVLSQPAMDVAGRFRDLAIRRAQRLLGMRVGVRQHHATSSHEHASQMDAHLRRQVALSSRTHEVQHLLQLGGKVNLTLKRLEARLKHRVALQEKLADILRQCVDARARLPVRVNALTEQDALLAANQSAAASATHEMALCAEELSLCASLHTHESVWWQWLLSVAELDGCGSGVLPDVCAPSTPRSAKESVTTPPAFNVPFCLFAAQQNLDARGICDQLLASTVQGVTQGLSAVVDADSDELAAMELEQHRRLAERLDAFCSQAQSFHGVKVSDLLAEPES